MTMQLAAKGTELTVSDPQREILAAAVRAATCSCGDVDCSPYVRRGRGATSTQLMAMARRKFVTLDRRGHRIAGAWVTDLGRRRLVELDRAAAERERVERAVRGW